MSAIAPTTEPRRPRRKKPRVPSSLYKPKGHHRTIKGVSRIYLEDIETAYDVMESFVPFSPSAQLMEAHFQTMQGLNERLAKIEKETGDDKNLAELEPATAPNPITIEISEYEPAYNLTELTAIPEKVSTEITMRVGFGDLRLRCTAADCDISTSEESSEAYTAYRQLEAILTRRISRVAAMLLSWKFIGLCFAAFLGLSLVNVYARIPLLSPASFIGSLSIWIALFWQVGLWDRRKAVVILQYRRDAPTFWEENSRRILTGIIIGVGTTILAAIALRAITGSWPGTAP
jgi:hypothetical protein